MSQNTKEYALFAPAVMEVERVYASAPAMCAVGCRKALELAVKWVYSADNTMQMPYKDNLQSLIHEPSFRFSVDYNTWGKLPFIVKRDIVIMSCLERMAALWRWWKRSAPARNVGRRPMMFTTNGFETYFWDDKTSPQRPVSGIFRVY